MASKNQIQTYLFSYSHEGSQCVFEIRADSAEDAKRRVSKLQYARYDGELMAKIPVDPAFRGLLSLILTVLTRLLPSK